MIQRNEYRLIATLAVCQLLWLSAGAIILTLSGLVGHQLATDKSLATLPFALMCLANAVLSMPAAAFMLKKSGLKTPADLVGKKLGAPVFDSGRKSWPIFAKANKLGAVSWISMDPPLRETMLVRGDIDAITGYTFTSLENL